MPADQDYILKNSKGRTEFGTFLKIMLPKGWLIPVAIALVPSGIVITLLYFAINSWQTIIPTVADIALVAIAALLVSLGIYASHSKVVWRRRTAGLIVAFTMIAMAINMLISQL